MSYEDSQYEDIGFDKYCSYCGKIMLERTEGNEYEDPYYHYYCNCNDAKNEIKIKQQIKTLTSKLPTKNKKIINQLRKQFEIEQIKLKYSN